MCVMLVFLIRIDLMGVHVIDAVQHVGRDRGVHFFSLQVNDLSQMFKKLSDITKAAQLDGNDYRGILFHH